MTIDRDPKAVWKPVPGVGTAAFSGARRPKGLVHTTEGFTLSGAFAAYKGNGYAPHTTLGPDDPDKPTRAVRWQHLPYTGRSTTLGDDSGGIRPNRVYVWQVEIVGTCDDTWKTRQGGRYAEWHVDNWPAWYREAVADLMLDWERWFGIPRKSSVTWRPYPASYGKQADQRLSGSAFTAYSGWLGHQHAPETTHGDPGDLDIADLFARMGGTTPPAPPVHQEEEDMTKEQAQQLAEVHEALATIGSTYKQAKLEPERYADLLKSVQLWGGRAQAAGKAAEAKADKALGELAEVRKQLSALAGKVGGGA